MWGHSFASPSTKTEDFPGGSDGKASVYNTGDLGLIPGSGRSPGEGNGNPLQYYCLENPMENPKRSLVAIAHGVTKSRMTERLHFAFFSTKTTGYNRLNTKGALRTQLSSAKAIKEICKSLKQWHSFRYFVLESKVIFHKNMLTCNDYRAVILKWINKYLKIFSVLISNA